MPKEYSHTGCFDFFGTVPRNERWNWSGRSADGKAFAVTLWQGRIEEKGRIYRSWKTDRPGEWPSRPCFVELIENLAVARDHAESMVSFILAAARDRDAVPRSIARCFPQPNHEMRVV